MRRSVGLVFLVNLLSYLLGVTASAETARDLRHNHNGTSVEHDFYSYSCDHLYTYADHHNRIKQCDYARTCNEGEGIFAPVVYCSQKFSTQTLTLILTPILTLLLIVLFRMVASTAEDFFCPALEMLSVKMGLPNRFAGVTLLALGNGAPDIAATVNAIRNDRKVGYLMSLGELTGAGMFISAVITGVVVVIAGGVPCAAALVRDVIMFLITLSVVYYKFGVNGEIGGREVALFFWMYFGYVMIVLASDLYHRRVVEPRLEEEKKQQQQQQQQSEEDEFAVETTLLLKPQRSRSERAIEHVIEAVSNYDDEDKSNHSGWSMRDENGEEQLVVVHLQHGGVKNVPYHRAHSHESHSVHSTLLAPDESNEEEVIEYSSGWRAVLTETKQELGRHACEVWEDIYNNSERYLMVKVLLTLELPFTILRQMSVPIPCDGYYCRSLVAISTVLSPFWLRYYFAAENDIDIFTFGGRAVGTLLVCIPFLIGVLVLRCAPSGKGPMSLWVSVPLAIYGFFIAATWIDLIADKLVDVLSFMGIVFHIPGPIMGLSVLAVGNSIGDLSANMAVAKKGLGNMAITACFAGPVFNFLIGLGLGFSALRRMTGMSEIPVELPGSLETGFIFSIVNCFLIIFFGVCWGKGTLRKEYGYAALVVYAAYAVTSLLV